MKATKAATKPEACKSSGRLRVERLTVIVETLCFQAAEGGIAVKGADRPSSAMACHTLPAAAVKEGTCGGRGSACIRQPGLPDRAETLLLECH